MLAEGANCPTDVLRRISRLLGATELPDIVRTWPLLSDDFRLGMAVGGMLTNRGLSRTN